MHDRVYCMYLYRRLPRAPLGEAAAQLLLEMVHNQSHNELFKQMCNLLTG